MSQNFNLYSQYYDLLYKDKDYAAETYYIDELIQQFHPFNKSIIELGSGTGKHSHLLAQKGYHILGIERSADMVEIAKVNQHEHVQFHVADIIDFETDKRFDVALSLFHVISYLNENQDLIQTFQHVHNHLNQDGIFIFDVWHSSAVNAQVVEKRIKTLHNEDIKVVREANPIIYSEKNIVEVNYSIDVEDLKLGIKNNFTEKHPMRHFSKPEIELLAYTTHFEILHTEAFLTKAIPSIDTWGVCYILRKL